MLGLREARLIAGLSLALTTSLAAQVLSGTVLEEATSKPLPRAEVTLLDSLGTELTTIVADAQGGFTLPIRAGRYSFYVRGKGYGPTYTPLFEVPADSVPVTVTLLIPGPLRFASIAAGVAHSCGVVTNGTVFCWGSNEFGRLGDGTTLSSSIPREVSGISTAHQIASKWAHTCALLSEGTVRCWGANSDGQLGDGTRNDSQTPIVVKGVSNAIKVAVGIAHSCALLKDGTVTCWGTHNYGVRGMTSFNSPTPTAVAGIDSAIDITAGRNHSCVLLNGGKVNCWGSNILRQLGNRRFRRGASNKPVDVDGVSNATAISAGFFHTCAVLADGTVTCWSASYVKDFFGIRLSNSPSAPAQVVGIPTVKAFMSGGGHNCAIVSDGSALCWGANGAGQLGDTTETDKSLEPVRAKDINSLIDIAVGGAHTCAVLSDSTAWCWGNNSVGQLGDGKIAESSPPAPVSRKE